MGLCCDHDRARCHLALWWFTSVGAAMRVAKLVDVRFADALVCLAVLCVVLLFATRGCLEPRAPPPACSEPVHRLDHVHGRRAYRLVVSINERDPSGEACWANVHPGVQFHRSLPTDTYPPYPKNMRLWRGLQKDMSANVFVRCDADTVVNATNLARLVDRFPDGGIVYAGKLGTGRAHERAKLGLGTAAFPNFVMGGMCEIVSHAALLAVDFDVCSELTRAAIGPYTKGSASHHSDVELGRCFAHHGIFGRAVTSYTMRALRTVAITSTVRVPGGSMCAYNAVRSARDVTVHAIKRPMTWLLASSDSHHFARNSDCSCSHSPRMVLVDTGVVVPRCKLPRLGNATLSIESVHVMGTRSAARISDVPPLVGRVVVAHDAVDRHQLHGTAALTSGEVAYLHATRRLLVAAVATGAAHFLVLEDDFLVHTDFVGRMHALQSDPCYGDALLAGGVVLLGSTVWSEAAWAAMEPEMRTSSCVDACRSLTGSYANVYSRQAAVAAIEWIDVTGGAFPYDHVYPALVDAGHPVKAAWQPLFVADVSHPSSVNAFVAHKTDVAFRHSLHRWGPRSDYTSHPSA